MGLPGRWAQVCPAHSARKYPGTIYANTPVAAPRRLGGGVCLLPRSAKSHSASRWFNRLPSRSLPAWQLPKRPRDCPGSAENCSLPGRAARAGKLTATGDPGPRCRRPLGKRICSTPPAPGLGEGTPFLGSVPIWAEGEAFFRPRSRGGRWVGVGGTRSVERGLRRRDSAEPPDPGTSGRVSRWCRVPREPRADHSGYYSSLILHSIYASHPQKIKGHS